MGFTGLPPYYDSNLNNMYRKILQEPLRWRPPLGDKATGKPVAEYTPAVDMLARLLERNQERRLGSGPTDAEEIKSHSWFKDIDFGALLRREVEAQFKPDTSGGEADASNFDSCFTTEVAQDSFVEASCLGAKDQANFNGFTFVQPSGLLDKNV